MRAKIKLSDLINKLNDILKNMGGSIAYIHKEEQGDPQPGPTPEEAGINQHLAAALKSRGITRLYKFQYEAYKQYMNKRDVVIVAGTGTGKTEAFLIPTIEDILREGPRAPRPHTIIMYPTKALARDQLFRFKLLVEGGLGLKVSVLDGDTPRSERTKIYSNPPHILVTNPDMMHYGLALSDRIRRLVSGYKTLVLDELHVYRGVFGSHVKWVIERLKRYASEDLRIIGAGATIGNPVSLGEKLFGRRPELVIGPQRRKGRAYHMLVSLGAASRWTTAALVTAFFAKRGLKTLCFVDSQQMSELIARIARRSYGVEIGVHRAGLPPEYRKDVEERFRSGELKAVVATPTMELGIDLGDLDVVIMASLPRSFSSYLQRAGRAGRRGRPGLILTLMGDDPIESYFLRRPREFFTQEPDPSYIEPGNPEIVRVHAAALLLEKGIVKIEEYSDTSLYNAFKELVRLGVAREAKGLVYPNWTRAKEYIRSSGLRSAGPRVEIVENGKRIGYRELPQALYDLYPGAIYYHGGKGYLVAELTLETFEAHVRRVGGEVNFYTKPLYTVNVSTISPIESKRYGPLTLVYGDAVLTIEVQGYVVREEYTGRKLSEIFYEEPLRWSFETKAMMTRYPNPGISDPVKLMSGYHALEHALIAAAKPVVGASDTDLGGVSYPSGHIVIYDSVPGGNGASRLVYERIERVHDIAENILASCDCEDGCPKCVYSPYCGNNNMFLSRKTAYKILLAVYQVRPGYKVKEEAPMGSPLA